MMINSIEINNFRQFKGKQVINFSNDEIRNITLILGDNTSGKTTLLQAFLWCLYGSADFKTKDALLNQIVAQNMVHQSKNEETISITIRLVHQDIEYIITRTQKYYLGSGNVRPSKISDLNVSYKDTDGQTEQILGFDKENKIEEILPKSLSGYFFYDTERFGNVSDKSDVTDSVKGLLGLTVLENARDHIGRETRKDTVLGILNASLSDKDDEEARIARLNYEKAEDEILNLEERIRVAKNEKEIASERNEWLRNKLKSMASSSELQKRKEIKERELSREKEWLNKEEENLLRLFSTNTYAFFSIPLMSQALEKLRNADVSDKGIRNMNQSSIEHIIERGKCVCGTSIVENNEAFKHLKIELEFLPPKSIGLMINTFMNSIGAYQTMGEGYPENITKSYVNILQNKQRIDQIQREIENISNEIKKNLPSADYEMELKENNKKIEELDEKIERFIKNIGVQDQIIIVNKKTYQSTLGVSEKNREIRLHMAYAQEIYNWIDNSYRKQEKSIRIELEKKINEYFSRIYHGSRKVEIDDKYRVTLITNSDDEEIITDESQGLETVKNFSFIAGLVDLAKNKLISKKDEVEVESEAYPLILDAPFSNADERHVRNIANILPLVAEQLILIVMAKDWNYAEKQMESKVGKRYILDKQSEVYTLIKEV